MKLFLCQSLETSDDEEEEASEEEESEELAENDDGKYSADSEEDMPSDGVAEKYTESKFVSGSSSKVKLEKNNIEDSISSLQVKDKPNKADESEYDSDASVSTDEDISLQNVTGKLNIKGGKEVVQVKKSKSNVPKLSSKTKSALSTVTVPARLKNVNTEMMVVEAIRGLSERGGSSVLAIKKYIMNNYTQLDDVRTLKLIKQYIKKAITNGRLVQSKGSGLGGSFKVSAEMNRLEEQKERQNLKKVTQKAKKDAAAKNANKKPKSIKKEAENGKSKPAIVKKTTNTKNTSKATKATKPVMKLDNGAESAAKASKVSATPKKMPKATDSKILIKTATKEAKPSTIANNQPIGKPKVTTQSKSAKGNATSTMNLTEDKQVKGSATKTALAPPITPVSKSSPKAMAKGKTAAMPKKKPIAKSKTNAAEVAEIGAGDADTMKPAKKVAGKKTQTK